MRVRLKRVSYVFVVLIMLIIAYVLSAKYNCLSDKIKNLFVFLPYILCVTCLVLCIWFQHSRVFFNSIFFMYVFIVFSSDSFNIQPELVRQTFINAVSILIPINILFFSFLKERGITSIWGIFKFFVVALEICLVEFDKINKAPFFAGINEHSTLINNSSNNLNIPNLATVFFILATVFLITRFFICFSELDIAFIGVGIAFYILIHFTYLEGVVLIFFSVIYLILTVTLLSVSYSMAYKDQLTGILSRRALDQEMLRLGSKYTIAMIDIDHFKKFNDKYGHKTGDDVLKMIASMIETVGGGGKAFRYGGEEFTILFKRKDIPNVIEYLEQLRSDIENRPLIVRQKNRSKRKPKSSQRTRSRTNNPKKVRITISIGVAERNERLRTPEAVIKASDKALYKAKRTGRNKIAK